MKKFGFTDLTTFKTGGEIAHYFAVQSTGELVLRVKQAKQKKLPIFIIGGGSDILVSDSDYDGVVIKYIADSISYIGKTVTAEAGVVWDDLVKFTVDKNLQGIEKMSGIPGTVGAAPIQNIGAYGQELSDTFVSLKAYNIEKQKFVNFSKKECKFGYRDSIFKSKKYWQKFIITEISLKLKIYKDKKLDLKTIREEILRVRNEKLDDWKKMPNAGSFFKNPIITKKKKEELEKKYKDIKIYPYNKNYKVFAGYLIEKAGWKGKNLGKVKVSDKHALIITNPEGKGTTKDILRLAKKIQKDVYEKFKINLEPEVQYVNL